MNSNFKNLIINDRIVKYSLKDRYIACLILHSVGDTIGFKHGLREFNFNFKKNIDYEFTLELLYPPKL